MTQLKNGLIKKLEDFFGLPFWYFAIGVLLMMDIQLLVAIYTIPKLLQLLEDAGVI